jgi:hypothetical protein
MKEKLSKDSPAKVSRVSTRTNSTVNKKNSQTIKDKTKVSTSTGTQTKNYASVSDGKSQKELMARKTTSSSGSSDYQILKNNKLKSYGNTAAGERKYNRVSKKIDKI